MAKNKLEGLPLLASKKRKLTLGDVMARRRVKTYTGPKPHHKMKALIHVFNRAAPGLGLSQNSVRMMNVLWGCVNVDTDFEAGRVAIVWLKTKNIMIRCGWTSLKTYKRAQTELRAAGLLSYKDSSNGVRYGKRDETGYIVQDESFGFVLTPLAAAYDELVKIGDQYEVQQNYKRMISANYIRAKAAFSDLCVQLSELMSLKELAPSIDQFEALRGRYKHSDKDFKLKETLIRRIEHVTEALAAKLDDITSDSQLTVLQELEADQEHMSSYLEESTLKRGQKDPSIIPITTSSPPLSNGLSDKKVAENEAPKMQQGYISKALNRIKALSEAEDNSYSSKYGPVPSFRLVKASMPLEICRKLKPEHGFYELWDEIALKAPNYGIEPLLLSYGRGRMGLEVTCAVMAMIFDKTNLNSVESYFRSLVKIHEKGTLNVRGSLHGIIDRRSKSKEVEQYGFALV